MDEKKLQDLVGRACEDIVRRDIRRAKDRLRSVLHVSPHYRPALKLMGYIYYQDGDYRNAVMHWSRGDHWCDEMSHACDRVFRSISRALIRENFQSAQYNLYAFAGTAPPDDLGEKLSILQTAYYRLGSKQSRLAGLTCAPLSGGCLIVVLAILSLLLGAGWGWFLWMGALALLTTIIVAGISAWSYFRAIRLFRKAMALFQSSSRG